MAAPHTAALADRVYDAMSSGRRVPPKKRKRQGGQAPALSKIPVNISELTRCPDLTQHACHLDRLADFHLHLGHHGQAERLAHQAAALRRAGAP